MVLIVASTTAPLSRGGEQTSDPCAGDRLPRKVLIILEEEYSDWRVEHLGDLDSYSRQLWIKAHPKDCPGIAVGYFCSRGRRAYAVLLIPRQKGKTGYRLVAICRDAQGRYSTQMLEEDKSSLPGSDVVSAVPPGDYSDPEGTTRVRLTVDAIQAERLEAGAVLYYWKNGRFCKLIVSE